MFDLLICVCYAVLFGLLGMLVVAAIQWVLGFIPMVLSAEIKRLLQGIIVVLVIIQLLLCIFGGHRMDFLHLHSSGTP